MTHTLSYIPQSVQNMQDEDLLHPFTPLNNLSLRYEDSNGRRLIMSGELEFDPDEQVVNWVVVVYENIRGEVRSWEGGVTLTVSILFLLIRPYLPYRSL